MPKPKVIGVDYARLALPVKGGWERPNERASAADRREAAARLKSLRTFETRARANPLSAGDPVARDRWPGELSRDYGGVPNLFRFELAGRWRGYFSLIGEPCGVRVWVLYLLAHEEYSRQSGYSKK